jgi:hypothetical protein
MILLLRRLVNRGVTIQVTPDELIKLREERESAAQSISDARQSAEAAASEEDDSDVHEGIDLLLNESCSELGYEFESSDDEQFRSAFLALSTPSSVVQVICNPL